MNTKKIERKRYAALTIYHTEWQSFTFSHITDLSHGPWHPSAHISGYLSVRVFESVCLFVCVCVARFPVACLKWVNLLMKTDRFNEIHLVIAIHQHNQQNQVSSHIHGDHTTSRHATQRRAKPCHVQYIHVTMFVLRVEFLRWLFYVWMRKSTFNIFQGYCCRRRSHWIYTLSQTIYLLRTNRVKETRTQQQTVHANSLIYIWY